MVSSRHHLSCAARAGLAPDAGIAPGAGIATDRGEVAVGDLTEGDRILTRDHGYQPLIWSGAIPQSRQGAARIRIAPGSFGTNLQRRPLDVGPGHRLLLAGPAVALRTGEHEALATADHLAGMIRRDSPPPDPGAGLHHILLSDHELILANGLWCESTFADACWFAALPAALGPTLRDRIGAPHGQAARSCLARHETVAVLSNAPGHDGLAA